MKHYIFLQLIHGSGGVQCYLAAKAKWLESNGWHVVVISTCSPNTTQKCILPYLNKYIKYGNIYTAVNPCNIPKCEVKRQLTKMQRTIGISSNDDEIIVESWNLPTSQWGELLAARVHGRHLFWTANEIYRGAGHAYDKKIDFFKYKMDRGEILTALYVANRLFEGYRVYKDGDFIQCCITEEPVQDVENEKVKAIQKQDWNICYIGRANKPYVPNVINGVYDFAKSHKDKNIQFIFVGDTSSQRNLIDKINVSNLSILELGDVYPIPRELYSKIDVVIAGSGSARHSVDEGALVISTDTETCCSHGLLGYDTQESVYVRNPEESNELNMPFDLALERALVTKEWQEKKYIWTQVPNVADSMAIQEKIIAQANQKLEYYNSSKLLRGKIVWPTYIKYKVIEFRKR